MYDVSTNHLWHVSNTMLKIVNFIQTWLKYLVSYLVKVIGWQKETAWDVKSLRRHLATWGTARETERRKRRRQQQRNSTFSPEVCVSSVQWPHWRESWAAWRWAPPARTGRAVATGSTDTGRWWVEPTRWDAGTAENPAASARRQISGWRFHRRWFLGGRKCSIAGPVGK